MDTSTSTSSPPTTATAPAVLLPPLVAIGASFGGVEALMVLVAGLPKDFPAIVVVVQHVGRHVSILPDLLSHAGALPASHPADGEAPLPGRIYVAPPDHHMLVLPDRFQLSRGPRENHARPAIDPTFRTAALHWGPAAIGVVLTGHMDDGTAGLAVIKACGGTAVVQDPQDAIAPDMPLSALDNVAVDHCVPLAAIAPLLVRLVALRRTVRPAEPSGLATQEHALSGGQHDPMEHLAAIATPSQLTCPQCGGTLSELKEGRPLRYRCHTGHAYTALSLDGAQAERTDHALQTGFRSLREREALLRRMAMVSRTLGNESQARAGLLQADRVHEQAQRLADVMEEQLSG